MSNLQEGVVAISRKATADVEPDRFINVDGTHTTSSTDIGIGISQSRTTNGEMIPVAISGVIQIEGSAAIPAGTAVKPAADGKAAAGFPGYAISLTDCSGDGDIFNALWIGPVVTA